MALTLSSCTPTTWSNIAVCCRRLIPSIPAPPTATCPAAGEGFHEVRCAKPRPLSVRSALAVPLSYGDLVCADSLQRRSQLES